MITLIVYLITVFVNLDFFWLVNYAQWTGMDRFIFIIVIIILFIVDFAIFMAAVHSEKGSDE